jgi:hypothetical protein
MQLNWRKFILIIICAEALMIYWNSASFMQTNKQPSVHPAASPSVNVPLTQKNPTPASDNSFQIKAVQKDS